MITFECTGFIHAPVAKVFAVVADPARIPEWRNDVPGITRISGDTPLGTTFFEEVHFMGKKQLLMKVTGYEPDRRLVIEAQSGMAMLPKQSFTFTPQDGGTRIDLQVSMRTSGFFRLMESMLPGKLKKIWAKYFVNLDQLVR